ncbi:MAG: hypothetical protein L6W00_24835 [Lentisphaeria bacterium]|nr:MAG: hypothetical protein L6W00_24835 [Lentisphaeria bacterium]
MGRFRPACRNSSCRDALQMERDVVHVGRSDSGEGDAAPRLLRIGEFTVEVDSSK